MIPGNERLIIVCGMAHSGTTILTNLLRQHPDIVLIADGTEAWLLENTMLPNENTAEIQGCLETFPGKRILLKRPWNEVYHADWMVREMPDAKYIYCVRESGNIRCSWSKLDSYVPHEVQRGSWEVQENYYRRNLHAAYDFTLRVRYCQWIYHEYLDGFPVHALAEAVAFLGMPPFAFDVRQVGKCDLKAYLREQAGKGG